jgi:predicted GH43/DUF377 family glycosyl hydrolase
MDSAGTSKYRSDAGSRSVALDPVRVTSLAPAIREPAFVSRSRAQVRPDPGRAVIRPFTPADDPPGYSEQGRPRAQRIADRVLALSDAEVGAELERLMADFAGRHRDIVEVFLRRFDAVNGLLICRCSVSLDRAALIGSFFCTEYSYEAAALFNPSIVFHPDQSGVEEGAVRFILSLRAVGEGHISSIAFRTGTCTAQGELRVDPPRPQPTLLQTTTLVETLAGEPGVRIVCDGTHDLSEVVISPVTHSQSHGIEDLRMVRFTDDDGSIKYYGTYTAFSGREIRQELLRTSDFRTFDMTPLGGPATTTKGMALFPRRIAGRYAMIGRQDNENILFLSSPDLDHWSGGARAVAPRWPWEFVQIGNCGSPIEVDEGWLVITHGVGSVRNYCIGACLLDREDPTKLLARTTEPILRPGATERAGYVPNVTYSCGALVHGRTLVLPFAIADTFTTFATMSLNDLLSSMA